MSDKTEWINKTRCTDSERKAIDITAGAEGLNPPEALRMLVREGAKKLGYWRIAVAPSDDIHRVLSSTLVDPIPGRHTPAEFAAGAPAGSMLVDPGDGVGTGDEQ